MRLGKRVYLSMEGYWMENKRRRFTPVQTALLFFLAVAAVLFFLDSEPYVKVLEGDLRPACFPFLQKGSYTVTLTYENSPPGNVVFVFSNEMTDASNRPGVIYVMEEIPEGSGEVCLSLDLVQGSYNVCAGTAMDGEGGGYLTKAAVAGDRIVFWDNYFLGAMMLAAGGLLAWLFWKLPPEKYRLPLGLTLLGILATIPLFSDFIFSGNPGDDIYFHLTRLEGIYRGLASGDFPVRITPEQMSGYGGLTAIMYPQAFLYPIAMLRFLGVSLMLCYKILVLSVNVATAFSGYYAAKNICKSGRAALWMSVFYTFSVYRLGNLYVRGALGEALAMVFLPLVIWGVYEVLWGERRWIILALAMTGVLESHVLSVEMCALFMLLELGFWLFSSKKDSFWPRVADGVKAVALTLCLNASFLVPFLYFCGEDLQCFHLPAQVSEHAAYFSQMFSIFPPATGASLASGTTQGEMPITMGCVLLFGAVLFAAMSFGGEGEDKREGAGIHCLVLGGLAVLMSSWIFPWDKIEKVEILESVCSAIQFPWRFLGLGTAAWSLVSAIAVTRLGREGGRYKWVQAVMAVLAVVTAGYMFDGLSQKHVQSDQKMQLESADLGDGMYVYYDGEAFRPVQLEYSRGEAYIKTQNGTAADYADYVRDGVRIHVTVDSPEEKEDYLLFPLYWFPGYEITVNGGKVDVYAIDGLVSCALPQGRSAIEVRYGGFWFFDAADVLSLMALAGLTGWGLYAHCRKRGRRSAVSG